MTPINIIRIESEEGNGIFTNKVNDAYEIIPEACKRHFSSYESCTGIPFLRPQDDGLYTRKEGKEWFCAFTSLEQLHSLLYRDEIKKLIEVGYLIKLLSVTNYQIGQMQVLYTKDSVVEEKIINSLF